LFIAIAIATLTLLIQKQWPEYHVLIKCGSNYVERKHYGPESIEEEWGLVILRYESPILFNNANHFKSTIMKTADNIKGQLLGVGIATRSGSMKSTNAAAIAGGKDQQARSHLLISGEIIVRKCSLWK